MSFSRKIFPLFLLVFILKHVESYSFNHSMLCKLSLNTPGLKGEPGSKGEQGTQVDSHTEVKSLRKTVRKLEERFSRQLGVLAYGRVYKNNSNCDDVYREGNSVDGFYMIVVEGKPILVYCEFQKAGITNWLIIQRRFSGKIDFYLGWKEYVIGFGEKSGEFWLGLDKIHTITVSRSYVLRVEVQDWANNSAFAEYSQFKIGNASINYRLTVSGYSGNAGDSLGSHNNDDFSTKDRDNDKSERNCAVDVHGAWWYNGCYSSNLNGEYLRGGVEHYRGMTWYYWNQTYHSFKKVAMKIRPI